MQIILVIDLNSLTQTYLQNFNKTIISHPKLLIDHGMNIYFEVGFALCSSASLSYPHTSLDSSTVYTCYY